MATFTMYLKDVVKLTDDSIGLDNYPIFDDAYREQLNQKIKDHFWNREIGQETIDMFVFAMRRKMNEIMPLYNQLYESELLNVDPFLTFKSDSTNETLGSNTAESVSNSSSGGKSRAVNSDFPQTQLSEDGDYASSASDSVSESDTTGTAQNQESATGTSTTSGQGFSGAMSDLLIRYRETFLNIDMLVIDELDSLFMGVWSNGDEFSDRPTPGFYAIGYFGGYW